MMIYFVRHGEPIYDPDCLTEKGKVQANALSNRPELSQIDRIYSSSSTRAIQTAEPLAKKLGKEIEILDWCSEKYTVKEFCVDEDGKRKWLSQSENCLKVFSSNDILDRGFKWYESDVINSEKYRNGMHRIMNHTYEFLTALGYEHDNDNHCYKAINPNDKRIALFAHSGFSKAFLSAVLDIPYPYLLHFEHDYTGVTVIEFSAYNDGFAFARLLQHSDTSHLYVNTK